MSILNLWRFLSGYLVLRVEGKRTETFLNLAVTRGIGLWDLKKSFEGASFKLPVDSFKQIRPLVRRTGCRIKILRKKGLPFWQKRGTRRKGFVIGVLIFLFSLYYFNSFIWFVQVTGTDRIPEAEVMELARGLGIKPGAHKGGLDINLLEQKFVLEHESIAWAGLRVRGALLQIEIVEKLPGGDRIEGPADLVASKDGMVERVLVVEGEAVVAPGDMVSRGDVLIRGIQRIDTGLAEGEEPWINPVRARGEVEARVWYESRVPVNMVETQKRLTGNTSTAFLLFWKGKEFKLFGPSEIPYLYYQKQLVKSRWVWRNITLPVELVTIEYRELEMEKVTFTEQEALRNARHAAMQEVLTFIPEGITSDRIFWEESGTDGRRELRVVVETVEDIAEVLYNSS